MSVRTVLGDVARLGATDYHEHLFQVSPLLPGDELVDEEVSRREAAGLADSGIAAMIDATPIGLGRNPEGLARISAASGLAIVATTGVHRTAHYAEAEWVLRLTESELGSRMLADVVDGMPVRDEPGVGAARAVRGRDAVRAGMLKVGIDYWRIDAFARRAVSAIGHVHRQTNAPVMVHLEFGSAAFEVLDALVSQEVPASAVVLAHADRNPDPGLHADLAAAGAFLGYDGAARHREHPDSVILDCAARCVELGAGDRLLLGGDVARATRFVSAGGMPGMAYLPTRFVPRLRERIGDAATEAILVDNPYALLNRFPDTDDPTGLQLPRTEG